MHGRVFVVLAMSDAVWVAMSIGVPATIGAIGAGLSGWRTSRKADTLITKVAEVHVLANDNLSKVTAALGVANEKILGLEKLMAIVASKRVRKAK